MPTRPRTFRPARLTAAKPQRPTATQRGYGVAWRRLRLAVLQLEPACRTCGAPATDVDHIVPKSRGGTDDYSNLMPLSASCHSKKTAVADGGFGHARKA